jgi:hypothetical protein
LSEVDADAAIAEQVEHHRSQGTALEWKAYAYDAPTDLLERLERHGFAVGTRETVLVLDLRDRPAWVDQAAAHDVTIVENAEDVAFFRDAAEAIFEKNYTFTEADRRSIAAT